ncbi:hypothetical protein [Brachybacterium sp. NPDC056505]|uniref:hypothetical protein n=1 Tax=Brachybacterium sp. NPDC056505 TaxID=3345843 RepID=UPI00366EC3D7
MTHGIGKPPIQVGEEPTPETMPIFEGSTPEDMQRWIWSLYRTQGPALVRGAVVTGTSSMEYAVEDGVAIFPGGEAQTIAVPFAATTVATPDAPTSGTRDDYVYVTDEGAVQVQAGSQPEGTALLDVYRVPANVTATTAAASTLGNRTYAPLFGASMGLVAYWKQSAADKAKQTDARKLMGTLTFTLESDRRVDMGLQVCYEMSRNANTGEDVGKRATFTWEFVIDSELARTIVLGVEDYAEVKQNRATFNLLAGTHTIKLYRTRGLVGTSHPDEDYPVIRYQGTENWPATSLSVMDVGAIE